SVMRFSLGSTKWICFTRASRVASVRAARASGFRASKKFLSARGPERRSLWTRGAQELQQQSGESFRQCQAVLAGIGAGPAHAGLGVDGDGLSAAESAVARIVRADQVMAPSRQLARRPGPAGLEHHFVFGNRRWAPGFGLVGIHHDAKPRGVESL